MTESTITEGLAEIKLITKKVQSKKDFVSSNLSRFDNAVDPLGNGATVVVQEMQAIDDLERRVIHIRKAIAEANLATMITIDGVTTSIFEWLTWKREIADQKIQLLSVIQRSLKMAQDQATKTPTYYKDPEGNMQFTKVLFNLDYKTIVDALERITAIKDKLDGLLSLKNATVIIKY